MQPKSVTFEYCLAFLPLYWIFKGLTFLTLLLLLKRIDFLSIKSFIFTEMDVFSLLSTNQSHIKLKFLLGWISISVMLLCWNVRQVSSAYKSSSHLTACSMPFIYRRNRSGPKIDPWGTQSFLVPKKIYLNLL